MVGKRRNGTTGEVVNNNDYLPLYLPLRKNPLQLLDLQRIILSMSRGQKTNMYLLYQLNGMLMKQLNELKKLNKKLDVDDDAFSAMQSNW